MRYEGKASVFLEAMACGIPVITTDVRGNREEVASRDLGSVVPFDDQDAFGEAIEEGLKREWNKRTIVEYARHND